MVEKELIRLDETIFWLNKNRTVLLSVNTLQILSSLLPRMKLGAKEAEAEKDNWMLITSIKLLSVT
ncbi:CLUMA_CG021195, isoform A [Clunio marinus]|uniref:CLUMA_CG021195, isoform A n=1 Tax=Clunio marinus TaxID=568069 RepID=A0A1J1J699_9DIPT|nr:CLUMA_CG021195, isoform A [Clunio marinus]